MKKRFQGCMKPVVKRAQAQVRQPTLKELLVLLDVIERVGEDVSLAVDGDD